MLSGAFNVIGFSWIGSPAATELETVGVLGNFCSDAHHAAGRYGWYAMTPAIPVQIVMDWFGKLLGLPAAFLSSSGTGGGGCIQGALKHVSTSGCVCERKLMHNLRAHLGGQTAQQAVDLCFPTRNATVGLDKLQQQTANTSVDQCLIRHCQRGGGGGAAGGAVAVAAGSPAGGHGQTGGVHL